MREVAPAAAPLLCADLPGVAGTLRERACEEILAKQPGGEGPFWWLQVRRHGIATSQAVSAVARAAGCDPERVGLAGSRDRTASVIQWFSVPLEVCDEPGRLRNAGFQGRLKTVKVEQAAKPVTEATVAALRWKIRIAGAAGGDGYRRAKECLDRLRRLGCPNLPPAADPDLADLGLLLARGQRLPARAAGAGVDPARCRRAAQARLFTQWVQRRIAGGAFATARVGDCVRQPDGSLIELDHPLALQPRLDAFAAQVLGPWFGADCPPHGEDELALLADAGLSPADAQRWTGGLRRALRVQPLQVRLDIEKADLVLSLDLPVETALDAVLAEVVRPAAA